MECRGAAQAVLGSHPGGSRHLAPDLARIPPKRHRHRLHHLCQRAALVQHTLTLTLTLTLTPTRTPTPSRTPTPTPTLTLTLSPSLPRCNTAWGVSCHASFAQLSSVAAVRASAGNTWHFDPSTGLLYLRIVQPPTDNTGSPNWDLASGRVAPFIRAGIKIERYPSTPRLTLPLP